MSVFRLSILNGHSRIWPQTYLNEEMRVEIMRDEKLERAEDEILEPSARPKPEAPDVKVLLENDVVEEDVAEVGERSEVGEVVVPQVPAHAVRDLLHAGACSVKGVQIPAF